MKKFKMKLENITLRHPLNSFKNHVLIDGSKKDIAKINRYLNARPLAEGLPVYKRDSYVHVKMHPNSVVDAKYMMSILDYEIKAFKAMQEKAGKNVKITAEGFGQ